MTMTTSSTTESEPLGKAVDDAERHTVSARTGGKRRDKRVKGPQA